MWVQNLKFVASPIPEIIGGIKKYGQSLHTPMPSMYRPNLHSVALPVPEIIAIAVLGWGCDCCEPPILEKSGRRATVRKSAGEFL